MAYRFKIDTAVNCVFVQHFEVFEDGEDMEQLHELLNHSDYVKNMNLLRDASQTPFPDHYNLAYFRRNVNESMSRTEGKLGTGRNVAWVVNNANDFKVIHQWTAVSRLNLQVIERRPFREVAAARKWLNIPESYEIVYPS